MRTYYYPTRGRLPPASDRPIRSPPNRHPLRHPTARLANGELGALSPTVDMLCIHASRMCACGHIDYLRVRARCGLRVVNAFRCHLARRTVVVSPNLNLDGSPVNHRKPEATFFAIPEEKWFRRYNSSSSAAGGKRSGHEIAIIFFFVSIVAKYLIQITPVAWIFIYQRVLRREDDTYTFLKTKIGCSLRS